MSRLNWDGSSERFFESGVDRGVVYLNLTPEIALPGAAWTGLVSISESPKGGEAKPFYLDGVKYINVAAAEEFEGTLAAMSAPQELFACDGEVVFQNGLIATQQRRYTFGLTYRSMIGTDFDASKAYKLHMVYNALLAPSQRTNTTLGDSVPAITYSWQFTTLPPPITGFRRTAHMIVDTRYTDPDILSDLEDLLYGTDSTDPSLPLPDDLIAMFS